MAVQTDTDCWPTPNGMLMLLYSIMMVGLLLGGLLAVWSRNDICAGFGFKRFACRCLKMGIGSFTLDRYIRPGPMGCLRLRKSSPGPDLQADHLPTVVDAVFTACSRLVVSRRRLRLCVP